MIGKFESELEKYYLSLNTQSTKIKSRRTLKECGNIQRQTKTNLQSSHQSPVSCSTSQKTTIHIVNIEYKHSLFIFRVLKKSNKNPQYCDEKQHKTIFWLFCKCMLNSSVFRKRTLEHKRFSAHFDLNAPKESTTTFSVHHIWVRWKQCWYK